MYIDVKEILDNSSNELLFKLEEEFEDINDFSRVVKFVKPVKVEGKIVNDGKRVFELASEVQTEIETQCDRCLTPVNVALNFKFSEKYTNAVAAEDDMEEFRGNAIDITAAVKRSVLMHLPMKVLCRDDCKGLCPVCGNDLNKESCQCDTGSIDPRFESLRALFKCDKEVF